MDSVDAERVVKVTPWIAYIRLLGFILIAVAAVLVLAVGPARVRPWTSVGEGSRANVADALATATKDAAAADSAPKQQVVNGWVARDLLAQVAENGGRAADRTAELELLVALLIAAACWHGGTSWWADRSRPS